MSKHGVMAVGRRMRVAPICRRRLADDGGTLGHVDETAVAENPNHRPDFNILEARIGEQAPPPMRYAIRKVGNASTTARYSEIFDRFHAMGGTCGKSLSCELWTASLCDPSWQTRCIVHFKIIVKLLEMTEWAGGPQCCGFGMIEQACSSHKAAWVRVD